MEIAKTEAERQMLKIVLAPTLAGRPFAAPPGVPADRAAALRAAFMAMVKDKAFLDDAAKARIEVQPTAGPDIDALLREVSKTPPEISISCERSSRDSSARTATIAVTGAAPAGLAEKRARAAKAAPHP